MAIDPFQAALIETWTLYGIGSLVIALRVFTRTRLVGLAGYQPDDYLIFFAWVCYTAMTVAAHIVGGTGDTSHLQDDVRVSLSPGAAAKFQKGSKWFMVGWYTYIGLIWTLKLNMLFLYRRLGNVTWIRRFILPMMIFAGMTGISIWILFATACRPFHKLWQILPDPGKYCAPQSPVFLTTVLVLNLVTDLCIVIMPIPIILPLNISIPQKIGLLVMFCAGIFIMVAAVLRVYFVLIEGQGQTAAIWSCREDIVAIVVAQATMMRPLFNARFWSKNTLTSQGSNSVSEVHEMSNQSASKGSRFVVRKKKEPYSTSVLDTKTNESEVAMMEGSGQTSNSTKTPSEMSETTERAMSRTSRHGYLVGVPMEVDLSNRKLADSWA
ncbi:hypothetical protein BCR34DRAFT_577811 [Clohesyomyces aquaticus]|uniref:Rhodopsin domain-containing protein n=1 Tax=Clohesyomyces aquaticus TaxID=1231657 RepID=A0A1Y1YJ30_9PLEO|nr:hypothetical protein BCR34DRAFT_577811 [Clohesyomyces aquaticus]